MSENKSTSLIILSLVLLTLSLVFLCLWSYNYYNDNQKLKSQLLENKPTTGTSKSAIIRDSLLTIYTAIIDKLTSRINSTKISTDSLLGNIDNKLKEINKLKEEISIILKNENSIDKFGVASEKIEALQQKTAQLQNRNLDIENGNKNLKKLLQQIISDQNSSHLPVIEKQQLGNKSKIATSFTATEVHLTALMAKDEKYIETNKADETEKLNVSIIVKSNNYLQINKTAEIIVVVLQPNGKVLQNSVWEAGTFYTPEGEKKYSGKINFDYSAGELKNLLLSLKSDKFPKGRYGVQIYFNGSIIGKMVKDLS